MWRWGRRWHGPGRPMKPRFLSVEPRLIRFAPLNLDGNPVGLDNPIFMSYDEFEAFRLVFYEGLTQEQAAQRMGVSRGTVWRCLENARRKIATMLAENRLLVVTPE